MAKQQKVLGAPSISSESMDDETRDLAYQLYAEDGYQNGRELEYWLQAEQQLLARRKVHLRRVA